MNNELATTGNNPLAAILSDTEKLQAVPIETVKELWAMNEAMIEKQERHAFTEAMQYVIDRCTPVRKAGVNPQTRSKYTKLEHVKDMLDPLLTEAGLSYSFGGSGELAEDGSIIFRLRIRHKQTGFYEDHLLPAPIDSHGPKGSQVKTVLHGLGSTMTYVHRIMLISTFGIETSEDVDGNRTQSTETVTADQAATLRSLSEEVSADQGKMLRHFRIERLEDLPASRYNELATMLEQKRK